MKTPPEVKTDIRQQRRIGMMRNAQDAALDLFESRGFDGTTMEDVARASGVGPATLYRNFGTKERLVLWDDYDPALLAALEAELLRSPPLRAVQTALRRSLNAVYQKDSRRILRRTLFTLSTPAIRAAALTDSLLLRTEIAVLFQRSGAIRTELAADAAAGAVVAALDAAISHWAKDRARTPLQTVLRRAFLGLKKLG